jgi:ribosomal protein S18 acetylase RimI-like enzyme
MSETISYQLCTNAMKTKRVNDIATLVNELWRLMNIWDESIIVDITFAKNYVKNYKDDIFIAEIVEVKQIIGIACGMLERKSTYSILMLYVDPAYRSLHVGTQLLKTMEAHAKKQKCSYIELSVHNANNNAKKFYEYNEYMPIKTILRRTL